MMMGGRSSKNLLDFLSNPDKAKVVIDNHQQAADAHARAADQYKKRKLEALEVLEQLRKKQVEHDVKHTDLLKFKLHLDQIASTLNARESELDQKHEDLVCAQTKLQQQNIEQQQILKRMTDEALAKDQQANQRNEKLNRMLAEVEARHLELGQRELLVAKREQIIKDLADKLR